MASRLVDISGLGFHMACTMLASSVSTDQYTVSLFLASRLSVWVPADDVSMAGRWGGGEDMDWTASDMARSVSVGSPSSLRPSSMMRFAGGGGGGGGVDLESRSMASPLTRGIVESSCPLVFLARLGAGMGKSSWSPA